MLRTINRSVKYKMLVVVLATTFLALLISAVALLIYEGKTYRDFLVEDARTQADILASMAAPALQFHDTTAAQQDLSLLASRPGIVAAAIYTDGGEPFATYYQPGAAEPGPAPALAAQHEPEFENGALTLFQPVMVAGQRLGTVYLRFTDQLPSRLLDYVLLLAPIMLLSLGAAALVSIYLQRAVSGPVLAVTGVARRIMSDNDFSLRAPKTTEDEIGVLVDTFNTMLEKIDKGTRELEDSNRRLHLESEERRLAEEALRAADERKDEFLATLAHELRNPLAPMLNAVQILDASSEGSEAAASRDIIRRQLLHMVRLIDDLLDVSRITRGKLALRRETVELASIIRNAIETTRPFIDGRGHVLEVRIPEEAIFVHGDAVRLSQVVGNLLSNAAKYTPQGGRIELSVAVRDQQVEIRVADNGIGFTPEARASMFEMFSQGEATPQGTTNTGLGVGLGLARRLVFMHGGVIEADSPGRGRGSTFVVRLDTVPAAESEPTIAADGEAADAPNGQRVLLVDDNEDFANSLAVLLRVLGHDVEVAHDAATALELAGRTQPDIAFLDLGLPDLSGYELAERMHALPAASDTILIAVSGWGQEEDQRRSRASGFAAHLVKPVGIEQIRDVLRQLAATA